MYLANRHPAFQRKEPASKVMSGRRHLTRLSSNNLHEGKIGLQLFIVGRCLYIPPQRFVHLHYKVCLELKSHMFDRQPPPVKNGEPRCRCRMQGARFSVLKVHPAQWHPVPSLTPGCDREAVPIQWTRKQNCSRGEAFPGRPPLILFSS